MELSGHLEDLGRGQDAAHIAERAMRFANQRDRYGQTLYWWNFQQAAHLISRSKVVREREPQLIEASEKSPDSFQAQVQLAMFYESTNQVKKASTAFDAALDLRPKDSMTRQRYAQMLQRSGQSVNAVTQYMMLLEDNPNALGYDYWEVMETFFQAGKVDELVSLAVGMISPSIGQNFSNEFAESAAQECMENNNPKAAIEIYEKMVEVQPNRYYTYDELASAYAAAGEIEKAIQLLREKVTTEDTPYAQVEMVSKLTELCKAADQIEHLAMEYEAKLAEKPEDPSLLYLVASMKIAANDLESSDALVDQLLDLVSMNVEWLSSLAAAYRNVDDQDRELRLLEATIEKLDPQNWWQLSESYQRLGAAYAQKGEKEKARNTFRKMGAARILRGFGYRDKEQVATVYMQHEMWDDAEALFTEIINDLSAQRWSREHAQQQLMEIKRRRDGLAGPTQLTEKTQEINLGTQRALAQQYMRSNQLTKAVEIYEQIATAMPEDLESRAQLATVYSRQNKHDKAIDTWKALLEADPENTKYQDGLVNAYRFAGKIPEALELAQKYIDGAVDNSVHYVRLAKVYDAGDRVDDAVEAYKKAIALTPGNGQVYRELAQLYLRKDDLDAAEKTFEEAIRYIGQEWERQDIERQLMNLYHSQGKLEEMLKKAEDEGALTFAMQQDRAQRYRSEGKLEKAVDAYKKALDMTAQSWDRKNIFNELVQVYVRLGENDLAMEVYETLSRSDQTGIATSHSPSGVKVLFSGDEARETLINAYRNQGKLEQLKTHFEDRLEKETDNPTVLEMVAEIYRNSNDYEQAAQAYQALCKAQPGNVRSFYYAAATLNRSNHPDLAQELLNQGEVALSASNHKSNMDVLAAMAYICLDGKIYAQAIKLIEEAIAITKSGRFGVLYWGGDSFLYDLLGKGYLGSEQYESAVNAYQHLANITQDDNERKRAEKAMRQAYKAGKLYEKQIPEKLQQVAENPDDPDAHLALAQAYEWSDQVDQAIAAYERADELHPDSAVILGPLAKLYADVDPQKAKVLYKRLTELTDMPNDRIQKRRVLIQLYKKLGEFDTAIAELRDFAGTTTEESERDAALHSLWEIYDDQGRETERIILFEELASQIGENTTVYELLGDAYKDIGNQEKASIAYTQWGEFRQKEINRQQRRTREYGHFASQLLSKEIMPEKALELALRVSRQDPNPNHTSILGWAYLINGQLEKVKTMIESESNTEARTGLVMLLADHYARSEQTDEIIPLLSKAAEETQHLESKALYIGGMIYHLHQAGETEKIAELAPGSFVREAESADTISREFKIEKDSNASGGKFLQGLGDDVYDKEENVDESDEVVTFDINVQQTGDYKIIARVLAPDWKTDSFFVKFDEREKFYAWDTIRSSMWRWQVLTVRPLGAEDGFYTREGNGPIHFPLSAGEHQLKLKKRDSGTKIDVFVFYRLR